MKHRIAVETRIQSQGDVFESLKVIDFSNSSDRKWMMNHLTWAMNNDREVRIYPDLDGRFTVESN